MAKDQFDIIAGELLRQAEAPVNPALWQAISRQLGHHTPPAEGSTSFGFGGGIIAGALLLAGLAIHSSVRTTGEAYEAVGTQAEAAAFPATVPASSDQLTDQTTALMADANGTIEFNEAKERVADASRQAANVTDRMEASESDGSSRDVSETMASATHAAPQGNAQSGINALPATSRPAQTSVQNNSVSQSPPLINLPPDTKPLSARIKASALKGYAPLEVTFENDGNAQESHWDFGIAGKQDGDQVTMRFEKPETYTVQLTAVDRQGNVKSDMTTITVLEGSSLYVPDSFTPNGDGINDTYLVKGSNLSEFLLTIVNSKGRTVFQTRNINEEWAFEPASATGDGEWYVAVVRALGVDGKTYDTVQKINIIY